MLSLLVQAASYSLVIFAVRARVNRLAERAASIPESDVDARRALLASAGNLRWLGLAGWFIAAQSSRFFPNDPASISLLASVIGLAACLWIFTSDYPVKARLSKVSGSRLDYFSFGLRWYGMHAGIFCLLVFLFVKLIPKTIEWIPEPESPFIFVLSMAIALFTWLLAASLVKDALVILSIRVLFPGRLEARPEVEEMLRRRFERIAARVPEFIVVDSDQVGIHNMMYLGHPLFDRWIRPRIYGGESLLAQDPRLTDALSAWAAATLPIHLALKDDLYLPAFVFAFGIPLALISEEAVRALGASPAAHVVAVWFGLSMFFHFKTAWRHELSLAADAVAVSRIGVEPGALADAFDSLAASSARLSGGADPGWWGRWVRGLTRERIEKLRAGEGEPKGFAVSRVLRRRGWRWFAIIFFAAFVVSGARFIRREFFSPPLHPPGLSTEF